VLSFIAWVDVDKMKNGYPLTRRRWKLLSPVMETRARVRMDPPHELEAYNTAKSQEAELYSADYLTRQRSTGDTWDYIPAIEMTFGNVVQNRRIILLCLVLCLSWIVFNVGTNVVILKRLSDALQH
jgi:hypothetical protein